MGPGGQEHRRTQRCVHMDADSSKRVCAGCGEAMPAAEGWHKCSKCKAPVHSHITCSKVHSDPCDEESHICDSCFVGLNHSVTVPLATLGKRMIADYLHDKGQEDAKKWFERHHQHHKWTLIEMNDGTDAGGGVPCHANAIERTNLQQKKDAKWERQKVLQFAQSQAEQVSQLSMNDLSFGDKMPRGYIQELGSGSSKIRNNKEVWTVNFFDTVKAEMRDPVGLNKLVWKVNWGQYPEGSLIMCSRQMRRWLLQDDAFADH